MTLMITSARTGVIDWPITVSLFSSLPILMVGIFCRSVGPVDRRLRYAQIIGDLRHVHEAVGQVVRFGCRGGSRSPYLRPGILAAFGAIIRYSLLCRERVAWHLEDIVFHGMAYRPLILHLVPSGRNEAQGVASSGRDKQRDTC